MVEIASLPVTCVFRFGQAGVFAHFVGALGAALGVMSDHSDSEIIKFPLI